MLQSTMTTTDAYLILREIAQNNQPATRRALLSVQTGLSKERFSAAETFLHNYGLIRGTPGPNGLLYITSQGVTFLKSEGQVTYANPPRAQQARPIFKIQLTSRTGLEFEARAMATPLGGEAYTVGHLPWNGAELIAVLKVLEYNDYDPADFDSAQTAVLQRLDLLRDSRLVSDYLKRIGRELYNSLFTDEVGAIFRMSFNQARFDHATMFLQLRFDADAVDLARYPWELLHDGHRHLLSAGTVEMTRYVTYAETAPSLPVDPPARLLFIESRPSDLATLPSENERLAVWNALHSLTGDGKLILERLKTPSYAALLDSTNSAEYHLIHFDGHGFFARRCPHCDTMNRPHLAVCRNCLTTLADVPPQGYLAFEDSAGKADFVSTEEMENMLLNSPMRLMFLSACQTGVVRGNSLFGGLGPGLVRAGVPAVVTMQFSVPVPATINFAKSFYAALARNETIPHAVAEGRKSLFRTKKWFIPTLYLRSQDDAGHLFNA